MPSWQCPFCGYHAIISDNERSVESHFFTAGKYGQKRLTTNVVVCPNADCRDYTVSVALHDMRFTGQAYEELPTKQKWSLRPAAEAKLLPDYVPPAIKADYHEACLIRDLSPKASATLARRCMQGILRDFWRVKPGRLVDEINSIESKVDPLAWQAIHAVRQIGNIGAHMESDINTVVDVDEDEAQLLIQLIETLIDDWYVARHNRQTRMTSVIAAAEAKKKVP